MEGYLRIGLLIIAAIILSMMFYESNKRRPKRNNQARSDEDIDNSIFETKPRMSHNFLDEEDSEPVLTKTSAQPPRQDTYSDLVIINVLAKPSQTFASYDLLQALSSAGMQYGEKKIFHYYLPTMQGKVRIFSLASATEPGYFDMDKIGEFTCKGLTLFMSMDDVADPEHVFEIMLRTAEQLADDLDGEIRTAQRQPWNKEAINHYRHQISYYVQ